MISAVRFLLTALSISLLSSLALAQAAGADVLFDQGRKLLNDGKYAEALEKFVDSNRIDPAPGTLLNIAECYVKLGKSASGWSTYREAAALAAARQQSKREQYALQKAAALEPTLARLAVMVPDAVRIDGLTVRRNGNLVPATLWGEAVPVDPGTVNVEARAPGHATWTKTVEVASGAGRVEVTLEQLEAESPSPAPPTAPPPAAPARVPPPAPRRAPAAQPGDSSAGGGTQRTVGWVVGALGLVGVGAGAAFYFVSQSTIDDARCPNEICVEGVGDPELHEDGRTQEKQSLVLLGTGAALTAAGVVLLLTAPSSSKSSAALRVAPLQSGAKLSFNASW